jgi:hypothetical protein
MPKYIGTSSVKTGRQPAGPVVKSSTQYRIEWAFTPSTRGGSWGGNWSSHTTLGQLPAKEAKARFAEFMRMWDRSVRDHFRLVKARASRWSVVSVL